MRHRKTRKWESADEDPTSGLINLFDIWMVFAVALLLAFVQMGALRTSGAKATSADAGSASRERVDSQSVKVTQMRVSNEKLTGEGQRLGTAYRLKSGEVVYVPETPSKP